MSGRSEFRGFLARFGDCYRSIEIRAICGRSKDDSRWLNMWTRIEYRPETPDELQLATDLPDTDAIKCIHTILPFELVRSEDVLASIEKGRLEVGGTEIVFPSDRDRKKNAQPLSSYSYYPRDYVLLSRMQSGSWGRARLSGNGPNIGGIYKLDSEELSLHLRALASPYVDFRDLLSSFGRFHLRFRSFTESGVLVIAPVVLRFDTRQCLEKMIRIDIRGADTFLSMPSQIGVIERLPDDTAKRYSVDVPRGERQEDRTGRLVSVEFPVEEGSYVWLGLSAAGVPIDAVQMREPSRIKEYPRLAAHVLFDPDFAKLEEFLNRVGRKSRDLEVGVAWLLHLCGMTAAHYGATGGQSEIDVVAFCDDPPVAVAAECSTSPTNVHEKLSKLVLRSNRLERALKGVRVQPVLFVSDPDCQIGQGNEKGTAKAGGVALMMEGDIRELMFLAQRGTSAKETLDFIRGRIPGDLPRFLRPRR